jgi:hypothetical protein
MRRTMVRMAGTFAFGFSLGLLVALPACSSDATGQRCGGNTINPPTCPSGYTCVPAEEGGPAFGDVGGVCKKN